MGAFSLALGNIFIKPKYLIFIPKNYLIQKVLLVRET